MRDLNGRAATLYGRYILYWMFGKVRYMSSEYTARKMRVKDYVARFAGARP